MDIAGRLVREHNRSFSLSYFPATQATAKRVEKKAEKTIRLSKRVGVFLSRSVIHQRPAKWAHMGLSAARFTVFRRAVHLQPSPLCVGPD
jgi:hypothetical protein